MKSSRKISHSLATVLLKSAEQSLDPKRVSAAMGMRDSDPIVNAIRQKYVECVNRVVQKHKNSIISDYAIDVVELVQPVLEKNMTEKDLKSIAKFLDSNAFMNLINHPGFLEACFSAREKMNNKVLDIVNGDEVYALMKAAAKDVTDDITRSFGLDDETAA